MNNEAEKILEALVALANPRGSTAQEIKKYLVSQGMVTPDTDIKPALLVALKTNQLGRVQGSRSRFFSWLDPMSAQKAKDFRGSRRSKSKSKRKGRSRSSRRRGSRHSRRRRKGSKSKSRKGRSSSRRSRSRRRLNARHRVSKKKSRHATKRLRLKAKGGKGRRGRKRTSQ